MEELSPEMSSQTSINISMSGRSIRSYGRSCVARLRWTNELHRCFLQALERLGGEEQATPRRIVEAMGVKGLSMSQVKSHLQMYRSNKQDQMMGGGQTPAKGTVPVPSSNFLAPTTPWCPVCCHESKCHRLLRHHRHLYSSYKLLTVYVPEQKNSKRHFLFVFKDLLRRSTPKGKGSFDDQKTFYNEAALGGKGGGGLAVGTSCSLGRSKKKTSCSLGAGIGIGGGDEGVGEDVLGGAVSELRLGLGGMGGDAGATGGGGIIP